MSAEASTWQTDDSLWSDLSCQVTQDLRSSSPWHIAEDNVAITPNIDNSSSLSDSDFSRLSADQCYNMLGTESQTVSKSQHSTNFTSKDQNMSNSKSNSGFETDHSYLNKLEKKLDKLYKVSGKAERRSMLKQLSDRTNSLFTADSDRLDSSAPEVDITSNPIVKHLFPQQQAITSDEKLELVKHDEIANRHSSSTINEVQDVSLADQSDYSDTKT